MALTKVPSNLDSVTATTQSQGDNSTNVATTAYVDTGLNALIDSAPGNLNTLNELAAAMNDNASFFSTVLPLSGGTMTGNLLLGDSIQISLGAGGDLVLSSDGTNGTIATSNGALILDTDSDIHLDANGGDVYLKDGGTTFGQFTKNGNDFEVRSTITNGDFKIIGERTAGTVNALTFDMSDGGAAIFNSHIQTNYLKLENAQISQSQGDLTLDVAGDIILDADGGEILLKDGGTEVGRFLLDDNNHLKLKSIQSNADILFQGNNGGTGITALRLDMSDAGTATFNHDIKVGSGGIVQADTFNNRDNSANIIYRSSSTTIVGNNANALVVADGGNVGIGTTSPDTELHLLKTNAGGLGARFLIHNNSSTSGSYCQLIMAPTSATPDTRCVIIQAENTDGNNNQDMVFKTSGGASPAERFRIKSNGGVVMNSSNLYLTGSNDRRIKLSDSGIAGVSDSNNTVHIRGDNDYMKLMAAGNGGFIFEENGVERMRINPGGTFGMGPGTGNLAGSIIINNDGLCGTLSNAYYNTVLGYEAADDLTTGDSNTIVGNQAGYKLTEATGNTLIGRLTGEQLTTGSYNTAVGFNSLGDAVVTGDGNTALGNSVMVAVTSGERNTGVGEAAGQACTTGNDNVFVGRLAGYDATDANNNVFVGQGTRNDNAGTSNQVVIGNTARSQGGGKFTVGTSASTYTVVTIGSTSWGSSSDERLKKEITDSTAGLSFINDLRPVTFKWKTKGEVDPSLSHYEENSNEPVIGNSESSIVTKHGFIAQEVKTAIDNHTDVKDGSEIWEENREGIQNFSPTALIPMLVKSIQELKSKNDALEARIETLEG